MNSNLTISTYDQNGVIIYKINGLCFCYIHIDFQDSEGTKIIAPWGGDWYLRNISNPSFRVPYETHFQCTAIDTAKGVDYSLRIVMTNNGNISIINDTSEHISPTIIYAVCIYKP